jgi:hypothetical protein
MPSIALGRARDKKDSERSMPTMRPGRSTSATRCVVRPVPHPRSKARSKDLWAKFERKERLVGAKTSATVASRAAARSVSPKAYLLLTSAFRSVIERTVGVVPLARNRAHEEPSNKPVKHRPRRPRRSTGGRNTRKARIPTRSIRRAILRDAVDNELVVVDIARLAGDE